MFCGRNDLATESDVEQKLLYPMLTSPLPTGLGFSPSEVLTKVELRRFEIDKGASRKSYFPDYVCIIDGIPCLVVEAKRPTEDLEAGFREARLYANEVNALYPAGINPVRRIVCSNGEELWSGVVDSAKPDVRLTFADLTPTAAAFAAFQQTAGREASSATISALAKKVRRPHFARPLDLLGGVATRDEEVPHNTFGRTIVVDYGRVFSPKTREDREIVVRNAYVSSLGRTRYVEPIDRLIRQAIPPAISGLPALSNTENPRELTRPLAVGGRIESQIILLVGSVGSGKSTFVDYLEAVALPEEVKAKTVWARVNLNDAPVSSALIYDWIAEQIIACIRDAHVQVDFSSLEILQKIFHKELNDLRRGPLAVLPPDSIEYKTRLSDALLKWIGSPISFAKALVRYLCAGPGKAFVLALDNCDKRSRDEQLLLFEVAQWSQKEFRAVVILPLRDVTYELHRSQPPLDTIVKGLVFRIEPPPFAQVLQRRVLLALAEMKRRDAVGNQLSYSLPNGMRVSYPASDQGIYLASILHTMYEHDRFLRQIVSGLSGRDVRRALEIFLDFCSSGHIGEDQIFLIRQTQGKHIIPFPIVARALLKLHRRHYDGSVSRVKNMVQCDPSDALPDHFTRIALLKWLSAHVKAVGPSGVEGFHSVETVLRDLGRLGFTAARLGVELQFLVAEGLVVSEHLRTDRVEANDLIALSPSGAVHLQLLANADYLSAVSEDTWLSDLVVAQEIADRLKIRDVNEQQLRRQVLQNARSLVGYLTKAHGERISPHRVLSDAAVQPIDLLQELTAALAAAERDVARRLLVANLPFDMDSREVIEALKGAGIALGSLDLILDKKTRRSRGFGFARLASPAAALDALLRSGTVRIRGRLVRFEEADDRVEVRQGDNAPTDRVYVGGLRGDISRAEVVSAFVALGFAVKDVYVHPASGKDETYAFVSLTSADDVFDAMSKLDGSFIAGRIARVRIAAPRQAAKGS